MVPLWFTPSALCFVGAAVLLYVDIDRRRGLGRRRTSWAKSHGFDYEHETPDLVKRWSRGIMSTVGENVHARNVVLGSDSLPHLFMTPPQKDFDVATFDS